MRMVVGTGCSGQVNLRCPSQDCSQTGVMCLQRAKAANLRNLHLSTCSSYNLAGKPISTICALQTVCDSESERLLAHQEA